MEQESRKEELKLAMEYGIFSKLKHASYKEKLIDLIIHDPYNWEKEEHLYKKSELLKKNEEQLENILLKLFEMFKTDYGFLVDNKYVK